MTSNATSQDQTPALPEWIRVLPRGAVELSDHREPFMVDEVSLRSMAADFRSRGVDLVIDYEHQSLQGERAPAADIWKKKKNAAPASPIVLNLKPPTATAYAKWAVWLFLRERKLPQRKTN